MFVVTEFLPNPHNPFQAPALRWRRCDYLVEHRRKPSPVRDDGFTHAAWPFLRQLRRCRDDTDRQRLAQCHPGINAAYQFYTQAGSLKRAEVEARLMPSCVSSEKWMPENGSKTRRIALPRKSS